MKKYPPHRIDAKELQQRLERLMDQLNSHEPDWQVAAIMGRINIYYLTGTMQNGLLLISRNAPPVFWVKRSYKRAIAESAFPDIRPMDSFRDAAASFSGSIDSVLIETEKIPIAHYHRFNKHFQFREIKPVDNHLAIVRAVKSEYEIECLRKAGHIHHEVLTRLLPDMLHEGMSEAELSNTLMSAFIEQGHYAVSRVGAFNAELFLGQVCFGESALIGNPFNSPGGVRGLGPSVPIFGSRERRLHSGDVVSVDTGCNVEGYHTDKTVTFVYNGTFSNETAEAHQVCLDAEKLGASMLRPGITPAEIHEKVWQQVPEYARKFFMGTDREQVRFLGHGVGLEIDEFPAIAKGFDMPLQENMAIALEPKAWIAGTAMVGSENTYLVTPQGGICIT